MSDQLRSLRLVIASPGDVRQERDTVSRVVDEINQYGISVDYKLTIKVVRWETDAWPGFHPEGPQGLIDPVIDIENSDLVVGIFWKRFGTPTAEARSGTVHELQHAIDAWRRKGSPLVMIYFSQQPYTPQSKEETEQWGQVINFRDHFPEKGLWWGYETPEEFQKLLRMHLTNAIRAKFGNLGVLALETTTSQPGAAVSQVWPASEAPASEFLSRIPPLWNKRTIGRDDAIRDLLRDLSQPGLVALTGAAGCGKTRVAVEVANRARTLFSDGVLFVELAPLAPAGEKGSLVPSRIATLAGVREQATTPPTKVLAEYIAGKQFLLVLDNCEHLAGSCAEVAEYLLMNCANLRILATSRVLLRIAAEKPYPLGCLSVPGAGKLTTIDAIAQSEAVQMFVERAQLAAQFQAGCLQRRSGCRTARALDGLPLAIELAAARLGVKSVQEMSLHSQDLLKSLGESRAGDFRSWSTLTAALKWSYDLLPAAEASFMRRLAVFAGGWSEAAAAAVTSSPGERDAVAGYLQNLVDHSLVASRETGGP